MRVLVTGASGFIGSRLVAALLRAGHQVVTAGRRASPPCGFVQADFAAVPSADFWAPHLAGIDAVLNAVGLLRETSAQTFEALHARAPIALFEASVRAGVRRIVQVSALGADAGARTAYHLSKKSADDFLLGLDGVAATVAQPSLVFGQGGASARLFCTMATMPVVALPGRGDPQVQPIHVDDLVAALVALVVGPDPMAGERVPLVGPSPLKLREFLSALREGMGLSLPQRVLPVPMWAARLAAAVGDRLPGSLLDTDSLGMLLRGNTAPVARTAALLGRSPRAASAFVEHGSAEGARAAGRLGWGLPLLRWSVAAVWIVTGILSFGVYPVRDSLALLERFGVSGALAPWALHGAALLDLLLGVAVFITRLRRPALWAAQALLMLGYTALLTWRLPEFWLHPFGPLLKNLPMLAAIALLWSFEEKR